MKILYTMYVICLKRNKFIQLNLKFNLKLPRFNWIKFYLFKMRIISIWCPQIILFFFFFLMCIYIFLWTHTCVRMYLDVVTSISTYIVDNKKKNWGNNKILNCKLKIMGKKFFFQLFYMKFCECFYFIWEVFREIYGML